MIGDSALVLKSVSIDGERVRRDNSVRLVPGTTLVVYEYEGPVQLKVRNMIAVSMGKLTLGNGEIRDIEGVEISRP